MALGALGALGEDKHRPHRHGDSAQLSQSMDYVHVQFGALSPHCVILTN